MDGEEPSYIFLKDGRPADPHTGEEVAIGKYYKTKEEAAEDVGGRDYTQTKYSSYQLPGGDNYREVLFTLPEKGINQEALDSEIKQLEE
jgi:hypothetical protein